MKMLLDSQWVDREKKIPVRDPYDDTIIDHVPSASPEDAELALASAVKGFEVTRKMTVFERASVLNKTAEIISTSSSAM